MFALNWRILSYNISLQNPSIEEYMKWDWLNCNILEIIR